MGSATPRHIHFHVGAHKTGTTYMQSLLRANHEGLADHGICFVDPWQGGKRQWAYRAALRAGLDGKKVRQPRLTEADDLLQDLVQQRLAEFEDTDPLVSLSCEVVLGNYVLTNGLYPHAHAGLSHVKRSFPEAQVTIFLCIRSFDRFLESGYVQRVLGRHETRTFDEYLQGIDTPSLSWLPVMQAAENLFGPDHVVIWPYEEFRAREGEVWQRFLGLEDWESVLAREVSRKNPSLSHKGMEYKREINQYVAAVEDADDRKAFRGLVNKRFFLNFMKEHFSTDHGLAAPRLLDEARRESLVAQYHNELAALRRTRALLL